MPTPPTPSYQQLRRQPRYGLATPSTSSSSPVFASPPSPLPPSPLSPVYSASIPLPHAPRLPPLVPPPLPLPTLPRVPLPPVRLRLTLSLLSSPRASPSLPSVVALRPCPFVRAPIGPALVPPPLPTMMVQVCLAFRPVSVHVPHVPLHVRVLVPSLSLTYPHLLVSRSYPPLPPPFLTPPRTGLHLQYVVPVLPLFPAGLRTVYCPLARGPPRGSPPPPHCLIGSRLQYVLSWAPFGRLAVY